MIKFHVRIKNIMKYIKFQNKKKNENHENHRISYKNNENHENPKPKNDNHYEINRIQN